jgi:hypothetical protein
MKLAAHICAKIASYEASHSASIIASIMQTSSTKMLTCQLINEEGGN